MISGLTLRRNVMIEWLIGVGCLVGFVVYMIFFNWFWWFLTGEKLWDDHGHPFSWLVIPIGFPITIAVLIAMVVFVLVVIPVSIGSIFI